MSRSYKKFPCSRMSLWGRSMKKGKQTANRKIRRKLRDINIDISNGRYYKHFGLNSWDLWEFKFHETERDIINEWEQEQLQKANGVCTWKKDFTLEESVNDWKKYYIRK